MSLTLDFLTHSLTHTCFFACLDFKHNNNNTCYFKFNQTHHFVSKRFSLSMALSMSRHHHLSTLTAFTFLIFVSAYSSALSHFGRGVPEEKEERLLEQVLGSQKRLSGPGSSPPTCRSKCGKCLPCKPVHVPIQPGLSMPLEYYPEAWRCKCGNKLFMP